ncbi:phosphatase PAP2 family protein [Bailinhaonella thermotolerans]|uniref:Phosphatase PAP2 family protein n=1 Tax=Bailinhaonella thermotolerans TaxID=1070861 RepID=A0A3A4BQL9_9ACTN|nr:phosphatase PAP2 family protein [Bailinhaonella thermotolerans]RJL33436.1 phosphatase PAP2 family protein [Bailinhaonella thermotolerans]
MGDIGGTPVRVEDVPDVSAEWYLDVVEFAHGTPHWVRWLMEVGTEALPVLLAALLVFAWWRARRGTDRAMALTLVAPAGAVAAYVVSEILKTGVRQERPCRIFPDAATIAPCPEVGDWSLPSNHATLAAGAAIAVILVWRAMAVPALLMAGLAAFSRVFVGVHYPHDVVAGALLGAVVAPLVALLLLRPVTPLVTRLRGTRALAPLLRAPR